MCVYICIYIYVYVYICICMYILYCVCMCVYLYTHTYNGILLSHKKNEILPFEANMDGLEGTYTK